MGSNSYDSNPFLCTLISLLKLTINPSFYPKAGISCHFVTLLQSANILMVGRYQPIQKTVVQRSGHVDPFVQHNGWSRLCVHEKLGSAIHPPEAMDGIRAILLQVSDGQVLCNRQECSRPLVKSLHLFSLFHKILWVINELTNIFDPPHCCPRP